MNFGFLAYRLAALFLFILATVNSAYSANPIVFTNITSSTVSNVTDVGVTTGAPTIYGGVLGNDCGSTTTSTCGNCTVAETMCNSRRIHQGLKLHIDFRIDGDLTGTLAVGYSIGGSNPTTISVASALPSGLKKGSTGSVDIEWGTLCDLALGDSTCPSDTTDYKNNLVLYFSVTEDGTFPEGKRSTINVVILGNDGATTNDVLLCDGSAQGICGFDVSPGDEKVYISSLDLDSDTCDSEFKFARLFYSTTDLTSASYAPATSDGTYKDLALSSGCEPSGDWVINELTNDVLHFFRVAIVDSANNVFNLSPNVADPATLPEDPDGFRNEATPSEVFGLLPKDLNCFIATAAYGSILDSRINILRSFRDQFLKTNLWGRTFVDFYYKYGPSGAKIISQSELLRMITRAALWPFVGFAWVSLHYGVWGALILLLTGIGLFIFYIKERQRGIL